ncbi:restriction endonuclease subunit S [Clostridium botulinum]|nr:restriction endonuclease subunit S [Clostridium botulinum]
MRNIKLPEGWRVEKLGSFTEIRSGGTPSRNNNKFWENGNIPWLKISDLKTKYIKESEEKITNEAIDKSSAKVFKKGTILYTIFATLGEVAILDIEASTNQAIVGIDIKVENVNKKYLYYFLKSIKEDICGKGRGVAQNNINMSILKNTDVLLPPIETQKKIVEILEHAEKVLEKRKKTIRLIDELVKSQFIEMFGDPNMNNKGWNRRRISEVCENKDSNRVPLKQADRDKRDGEYPYYGATGIIDYIDDYIFDGLYLLIAEDGKNLETKNKDIAFLAQDKFWVNNHAHVVCATKESNLYYLKYVINNINLKPYITGIDQLKLNRSNLDKIIINVPPIELQNQFANFVKQVDKLKFEMEESLKELENNFNSLMQSAFKGELFK